MCGHSLPVGLVSLTVLRVRWSGCCDSLIDAPKKDGKKVSKNTTYQTRSIQCKALLTLVLYSLLNALLKQNMKDKPINFERQHG